jgi:AcrR family transcriptional regulator
MTSAGEGGAPAPGGVRARRRNAVKARLTECALRLFTEQGYDETTVDDIAAAGKTSRSSFFRYFGTKDDVVLTLLDEMGDDYVERYRETLAQDGPRSALARAVTASVHKASEDPELYALMKLVVTTPSLRSRLQVKIEDWRLELQRLTAEHLGMDDDDLLPASLTHLVVGASSAAFTVWLQTEGKTDLLGLLDDALAYARDGYGSMRLPGAAEAPSGTSRSAPSPSSSSRCP